MLNGFLYLFKDSFFSFLCVFKLIKSVRCMYLSNNNNNNINNRIIIPVLIIILPALCSDTKICD